MNNGNVHSPDTIQSGDVVQVHCNEGFNLTGAHETTCLSNGSWSSSPRCQILKCENITMQITDLMLRVINARDDNNKACFECPEEYKLVGNHCISCIYGNWPMIPHCIQMRCERLQIENGKVDAEKHHANITCDNGYELVGDTIIFCNLEKGTWSSNVSCQPVDCGLYPALRNGHIALLNGSTTFTSLAVLECNEGYVRDSPKIAYCLENGMYSLCIFFAQVSSLKLVP